MICPLILRVYICGYVFFFRIYMRPGAAKEDTMFKGVTDRTREPHNYYHVLCQLYQDEQSNLTAGEGQLS